MIFYFHYALDALAVSYVLKAKLTMRGTAENGSFCRDYSSELDGCTKTD